MDCEPNRHGREKITQTNSLRYQLFWSSAALSQIELDFQRDPGLDWTAINDGRPEPHFVCRSNRFLIQAGRQAVLKADQLYNPIRSDEDARFDYALNSLHPGLLGVVGSRAV